MAKQEVGNVAGQTSQQHSSSILEDLVAPSLAGSNRRARRSHCKQLQQWRQAKAKVQAALAVAGKVVDAAAEQRQKQQQRLNPANQHQHEPGVEFYGPGVYGQAACTMDEHILALLAEQEHTIGSNLTSTLQLTDTSDFRKINPPHQPQ